jgi:hypothetical protein
MTRVALIVTGEVEHRALHQSLERIFPGVVFEPQLMDGFTSAELPAQPRLTRSADDPTLVEKLAASLVSAVDPGRTGEPADVVTALQGEPHALTSRREAGNVLRNL